MKFNAGDQVKCICEFCTRGSNMSRLTGTVIDTSGPLYMVKTARGNILSIHPDDLELEYTVDATLTWEIT